MEASLCRCHTACIKLSTTRKRTKDSFESFMSAYLKRALEPMFITPPSMLANDYKAVYDFLMDLTEATGPILIVLNGIENAFGGDSDEH
ncbi:hypothetical protein HDU80_001479, partial [Chytriomyces hyalinus]